MMIANVSIARQISELMLGISQRLDESIVLVQKACPPEEFKAYRLAVGKILGEILLETLNPLYAQHPELKPPKWGRLSV